MTGLNSKWVDLLIHNETVCIYYISIFYHDVITSWPRVTLSMASNMYKFRNYIFKIIYMYGKL